jgi:hypothetical protein
VRRQRVNIEMKMKRRRRNSVRTDRFPAPNREESDKEAEEKEGPEEILKELNLRASAENPDTT